jgi:hypothetical protein
MEPEGTWDIRLLPDDAASPYAGGYDTMPQWAKLNDLFSDDPDCNMDNLILTVVGGRDSIVKSFGSNSAIKDRPFKYKCGLIGIRVVRFTANKSKAIGEIADKVGKAAGTGAGLLLDPTTLMVKSTEFQGATFDGSTPPRSIQNVSPSSVNKAFKDAVFWGGEAAKVVTVSRVKNFVKGAKEIADLTFKMKDLTVVQLYDLGAASSASIAPHVKIASHEIPGIGIARHLDDYFAKATWELKVTEKP